MKQLNTRDVVWLWREAAILLVNLTTSIAPSCRCFSVKICPIEEVLAHMSQTPRKPQTDGMTSGFLCDSWISLC